MENCISLHTVLASITMQHVIPKFSSLKWHSLLTSWVPWGKNPGDLDFLLPDLSGGCGPDISHSRGIIPGCSYGCGRDSAPSRLLDRGPQFFVGCCPEATFSSFLTEPLTRQCQQSVQSEKEIESYSKTETTGFCKSYHRSNIFLLSSGSKSLSSGHAPEEGITLSVSIGGRNPWGPFCRTASWVLGSAICISYISK